VDYAPFLVSFAVAQNLPPPRPPRLPRPCCLISGCLATTVKPTRNWWVGFAIALSGE